MSNIDIQQLKVLNTSFVEALNKAISQNPLKLDQNGVFESVDQSDPKIISDENIKQLSILDSLIDNNNEAQKNLLILIKDKYSCLKDAGVVSKDLENKFKTVFDKLESDIAENDKNNQQKIEASEKQIQDLTKQLENQTEKNKKQQEENVNIQNKLDDKIKSNLDQDGKELIERINKKVIDSASKIVDIDASKTSDEEKFDDAIAKIAELAKCVGDVKLSKLISDITKDKNVKTLEEAIKTSDTQQQILNLVKGDNKDDKSALDSLTYLNQSFEGMGVKDIFKTYADKAEAEKNVKLLSPTATTSTGEASNTKLYISIVMSFIVGVGSAVAGLYFTELLTINNKNNKQNQKQHKINS